ncbi:glycoside hydrolase family 10 protein [Bacillus halotolerans]|uniref:glycoside hydrolase family 10 protein n=1 Tax=Bacillus halotolerans TaxID=260554 RepID=UPI002DB86E4B|nr:glycoside hydrolase family 10 protein [Bacillus halotolerans]MEC0251899.1 glycoside hydrolase family 10 protein [Bacillus halotolerans]MEC0359018.1 glycoside hydrolase family 10 protein [Bacillus halotolerans]
MKGCQKPIVRILVSLLIGTLIISVPYLAKAQTDRELRAVWIASVLNLDWPSKKGLSIEAQKQEYFSLLDDVQSMGMNAVIVQIKPTADAFYPSAYGPWSEYLTGVQGKDPGYDPLAFMIEEAHKRNLEFHAWVNPYRITMNHTDLNKLSDDHPARKHPDWVVAYGKQLYYNPGIPEARDFIIEGIEEVVKHYDVDAVHMDDYFYPYKIAGQEFPDTVQYEQYGKDTFPDIDDWRRDNVNQLVSQINQTIKAEKPYVKFGISPFGVWRNAEDDPTGSNTKAGVRNYDDLYADTRHWIQQGDIDYIAPQIYWSIGFNAAAYDVLADWWSNEVKNRPVHLYIGQAAYKINNNFDPPWSDPEEYARQINLNRQLELVKGSMHFSLKDLNKNPLGIKDRLITDLYSKPALVPEMPWLDSKAPKKPKLTKVTADDNGNLLHIQDHPSNRKTKETAYYAIYRAEGKQEQTLLATARKTSDKQTFLDDTAEPNKTYSYYVTSADRLHNESKASKRKINQ